MNRRDLIKLLLSSAIAEAVDVEKLLWTPKPIITVPELPMSLWGIPYHCDRNATTGTWLGINRTLFPEFKSTIPEAIFCGPLKVDWEGFKK